MKSLWLFGIVLLFAFLFAYASATETVFTNWCLPSVQASGIAEELWGDYGIVITSYDVDCQCYPTDIIKEGTWFGEYCNAGFLHETRTVEKLRTPTCKDKYFITESREVPQDFCKKCPEPRVVGDWVLKGCQNGKNLYERKVIAQVFSPLLDKCYKQNFVEFKFTEEPCTATSPTPPSGGSIDDDITGGQVTNMFLTFMGQYGWGLIAVLAVIAGYIFFMTGAKK